MIDINTLIKEALLSKNKIALNAYKNIKAEIQKNQTAKGAKPLDENGLISLIAKYASKLEDAILQFSEAHRDDLVSEYTSELEVVKKLLPEPVNESEICSFLEYDETILEKYEVGNYDENSTFDETVVYNIQIPKKDMGKVIKYVKSKFPTADGKMISDIVKKYVI